MGTSTDGILCHGICFESEEDGGDVSELPWMKYDEEGDREEPEEWWLQQTGFQGGDYDTRTAWLKSHPMPFEWVTHCSGDYPMYILAVPGTHQKNSRGYPQKITSLDINPEALARYNAFLKEHGISGEPEWWLASMWG